MSLATSLIKSTDSLLAKLDVTDRPIYKRVTTRTGGDDLIGRPGVISKVDTLLSPQPALQTLAPALKGKTNQETVVFSGTAVDPLTDYLLLCSPTSLSRADLANPDLSIVFKPGGGEEVCSIEGFEVSAINGQAVLFTVLVRSRKR
jgi:hypothetical protein